MSTEFLNHERVAACPEFDAGTAEAFLSGALPEHEARAFAEHAEGCAGCRGRLDELRPFVGPGEAPRASRRIAWRKLRLSRARAASAAARAGMGLVALLIIAGAAVFLGLTVRSQTTRPGKAQIDAGGTAAPARGARSARAGALGGAPALAGVDEDGDGIDDGVASVPPAYGGGTGPAGPSAPASPATIAPYSGTFVSPSVAPPPPWQRQSPATNPEAAKPAPSAPAEAATGDVLQPAPQPPARRRGAPRDGQPPAASEAPAADAPPAQAPTFAPRRAPRVAPATPADARAGELRRVGAKTFRREADGGWVDVEFPQDGDLPVTEVVAGSAEYAALLEQKVELVPFLRLSDRIVVVLDGAVYRVLPKER